MIKTIKESFSYNKANMPVGLQILLQIVTFISTAIATILLAPGINESFESQKRRSEFYVKAIESLSGETKDIIGNLAVIFRTDIDRSDRKEAYVLLKKDLAKLHWRSVEFAMIFDNKKADTEIKNYQSALKNIDDIVSLDQKNIDSSQAANVIDSFGMASAKLMNRLAREADVNSIR